MQWDTPKAAVPGTVDSFVREATRTEGEQPTTVGHGITPDPIRDLPYDSPFAAADISIKEPRRVLDADQTGCSFEDCQGRLGKTRPNSTCFPIWENTSE